MLAPIFTVAIALLLTLGGLVAVLAIADSALKARHAYRQLMREAALMQSGFAFQIEARDLRVRRAPARLTPIRRPQAPRMQAVPVYAAA